MCLREEHRMHTDIDPLLRIASHCKKFDNIAKVQAILNIVFRNM